MRSNANRGDATDGGPSAARWISRGLARHISLRTLETVLAACCRRVREGELLESFEMQETGVDERSYFRLPLAAVSCEAWLIRWPAGSIAPLHDHGSAHGIAQVLSGTLHEVRSLPGVAALEARDWRPGQRIELARGTCHEVRNSGAETAFSVHVYAPRLERMTFYDRGARGELLPVRQEQTRQWQDAMQVSE